MEDLLLERRDLEGLLEGRLELLFEWSERVLLLLLLLDQGRVIFLGRVILLYILVREERFFFVNETKVIYLLEKKDFFFVNEIKV